MQDPILLQFDQVTFINVERLQLYNDQQLNTRLRLSETLWMLQHWFLGSKYVPKPFSLLLFVSKDESTAFAHVP